MIRIELLRLSEVDADIQQKFADRGQILRPPYFGLGLRHICMKRGNVREHSRETGANTRGALAKDERYNELERYNRFKNVTESRTELSIEIKWHAKLSRVDRYPCIDDN